MPNAARHPRQWLSPTALWVIFVVFGTLAIFTSFVWNRAPQFNHSLQTELSHARLLHMSMKLYAADHNGAFPSPPEGAKPFENANEAFRKLVPTYIPTKDAFYSKTSFWTPRRPNKNVKAGKTPEAGENHFAYVANLSISSNPRFPLIASGFGRGTPGLYNTETQKNKSLKRGVVVVRADGSGKLELFPKGEFRVYDENDNGGKFDIFKPAPGWLRPDQTPLNPE